METSVIYMQYKNMINMLTTNGDFIKMHVSL